MSMINTRVLSRSPVVAMSSKRIYTFNFLLLSLAVVVFGYVIRSPLLPIKNETKVSLGYPKDSLLNFTELTGKYGYISDEHRVVTEDGYILTIFRIVSAKNCIGKKRTPPVFLMHGLLQSADSWIDSGTNAGLAYLIADGCYDLWVGNCRGNYYSRSHLTLNPDKDTDYWQFDIEEIGKYDLPAMIDYVLKYTGSKKLNYIGFSQGTGTYLVMCSERPEYCEKAQVLIALAPAARLVSTQSAIFRFLTESLATMEGELSKCGVTEVFPKGSFSQEFLAFFCHVTDATERICEAVLDLIDHVDDFHVGSRTNHTTRNLFGHFPASTSLKNMARYGQAMKSKRFQKYDYGEEMNLKVYGSKLPPLYNLSAVTVPVMCIYGKNDGLVDTKDVKWLLSKLPNVLEAVEIKNPLWTHLDVTYSQHTGDTIMPKINEYLTKYSRC